MPTVEQAKALAEGLTAIQEWNELLRELKIALRFARQCGLGGKQCCS